MATHYRVEQNNDRQESMDGAKPLNTVNTNSLGEAKRTMKSWAESGQLYAAIFINRDGKCIDECGRGTP